MIIQIEKTEIIDIDDMDEQNISEQLIQQGKDEKNYKNAKKIIQNEREQKQVEFQNSLLQEFRNSNDEIRSLIFLYKS